MDRSIVPSLKEIKKVELSRAGNSCLDNRVRIFDIDAGTQEVIKIEFIFRAGRWVQPLPLIASVTNAMLNEGTKNHTAEVLAEALDFYGAYLEQDTGYDNSIVAVYSLSKHIPEVLPLFEEIIKWPVFPENELEIHLQNRKQDFIVNSRKVVSVARRKFRNLLFGDNHPYGRELTLDDFGRVKREHLSSFHSQKYSPGECDIIISGKITDNVLPLLNKYFGGKQWLDEQKAGSHAHGKCGVKPQKLFLKKEDALQSAIIIGKHLFTRSNPDWLPMMAVNTILGGYFGSRLMKNIREDKGYTYGIYSAVVSLRHEGYFFIESEVDADVCGKAREEIYKELKRLRTEPVGSEELNSVKNYMMGHFLRSIDGPFALADRFKTLLECGLDYNYYEKYWNTIRNITPDNILGLASKYLNEDDMYELVVGK